MPALLPLLVLVWPLLVPLPLVSVITLNVRRLLVSCFTVILQQSSFGISALECLVMADMPAALATALQNSPCSPARHMAYVVGFLPHPAQLKGLSAPLDLQRLRHGLWGFCTLGNLPRLRLCTIMHKYYCNGVSRSHTNEESNRKMEKDMETGMILNLELRVYITFRVGASKN